MLENAHLPMSTTAYSCTMFAELHRGIFSSKFSSVMMSSAMTEVVRGMSPDYLTVHCY